MSRPKSLGHYLLGKTLGEGTFGTVKLGRHILTGEKVAVKVLEKARILELAEVDRVTREIAILREVRHPHVAQLYAIVETPGQLYLVMEFAPGGELFDYIVEQGRVAEAEAARFVRQIASALELLHAMGIVHRDLKPENLLLDQARNVKLVDFGLSNRHGPGELLSTACGSPCYAPPEMLHGGPYAPAGCDLWSLGVLLFATVAGFLPFEDANTAMLYAKICKGEYCCPAWLSPGCRDLVCGLLTTDPGRRLALREVRLHPWVLGDDLPADGPCRCGDPACPACPGYVPFHIEPDEDVLEEMQQYGFAPDYARSCLLDRKLNHVTATYHLVLVRRQRGDPPGFPQAELDPEWAPAPSPRRPVQGRHQPARLLQKRAREAERRPPSQGWDRPYSREKASPRKGPAFQRALPELIAREDGKDARDAPRALDARGFEPGPLTARPPLTERPATRERPGTRERPSTRERARMPLSARERPLTRERLPLAARKHGFNVSCTSSRSPPDILREILRACQVLRVPCEQQGYLVKCLRGGCRFDVDVQALDMGLHVVGFRRVVGDAQDYRQQAAKLLGEMRL